MAPATCEKLSLTEKVLLACVRFVIGVPMTKELKRTFSMPSIWGASTAIPGVPGPVTKPCEARLGPTPPEAARRCCIAHVAQAKFVHRAMRRSLVSPRLINCERPRSSAAKPGTVAPPCPVG